MKNSHLVDEVYYSHDDSKLSGAGEKRVRDEEPDLDTCPAKEFKMSKSPIAKSSVKCVVERLEQGLNCN